MDAKEPQYDPTRLRSVLFSNHHHHHAFMMLTTTRFLSLCRTSSPSSLNHAPFYDCESAFAAQDKFSFDLKALLDGNRDPWCVSIVLRKHVFNISTHSVQSEIFHLPGAQRPHLDQEGGTHPHSGITPSPHLYKKARLSEDNLLHSQWTFGWESPAWSTDSSYNSPLSAASSTRSNYEQVESPFDNLQQPIQRPTNFQYPQSDLLAWPGQFDTPTLGVEQGHIADLTPMIVPVVGPARGTKRKHSLTPPTSPAPSVSSAPAHYSRHRRAKKNRGIDTQMATCSWLIPDKNGALVQCGEAFTNRTLPTHMREQHQPWVRDDNGAMVPCPDNHELRCEWAGCQQLMKWGQLSRHIRTDLGWTVVNCLFCQKVLSRKDALDRHLRTNSCPAV